MTVISPHVRLDFQVDLDSAADGGARIGRLLDAFVAAARASGMPELTAFTAPVAGKARSSGFGEWVTASAESMSTLLLTFGPLHGATVQIDGATAEVSLGLTTGRDQQVTSLLASTAAVLVALAARWKINRGALLRLGEPGLSCVPRPPVVRYNSHAAVVTAAQVADAYADEAAFFAAWPDKRETFGQWVLFRGLDTVPNVDFLRVLIDSQWALARAARPKLTKYRDPAAEDFEWDVYHAGSPTLEPVAHVAGENVVEVTCTPPDGEFIRGWEVFNLRHIITTGALEDGRKVDAVRVVFLERGAAEANKRVLLDIGARVAYMSASGEPAYVED